MTEGRQTEDSEMRQQLVSDNGENSILLLRYHEARGMTEGRSRIIKTENSEMRQQSGEVQKRWSAYSYAIAHYY